MPTKPNQLKKSHKLRTILIVALVVLCGACGVLLYRHHQNDQAIAKERAQYTQAEKDLDSITAQIIAKFGQPDDQKKVKECGHTSDTFELNPKGDLFCNIGWILTYHSQDVFAAKTQVQQLEELMMPPERGNLLTDTKITEAVDSSATTPFDLGGFNYSSAGLHCFRAYTLVSSQNPLSNGMPSSIVQSNDLNLRVELNCSAPAPRTAVYPLKNL